MSTDNFDVNGGTGGSQFVLQSHFVLSSVSMKAAVDLQVTGNILLPVEHKQPHQPLLLTLKEDCFGWKYKCCGKFVVSNLFPEMGYHMCQILTTNNSVGALLASSL